MLYGSHFLRSTFANWNIFGSKGYILFVLNTSACLGHLTWVYSLLNFPCFIEQEGDVPELTIKFGTESVIIDSWTRKKQYDAFCAVLGSGVYQHLQVKCVLKLFGWAI